MRRPPVPACTLCLLAVVLLAPPALQALEGRRIVPIRETPATPPPGTAPLPGAPAPVTREECTEFVHALARNYRAGTLERFLDPGFPQRSALLDALERSDVTARNVALTIDAIESIRRLPWTRDANGTWQSRCIVDLRVRLAFDSPAGSARTVYPASRMRWHLGIITGDDP